MLALMPVGFVFSMLSLETSMRCTRVCIALRLLLDVVDALVCTRMHLTTPDDLRNRVDALLKACVEVGWSESMIPKFHGAIHYAFHLARFNCLPTCWVHERKHKVIKRYGTDIENLSTYSRSVISEATSHQLESLRRDCALDLGFGFDVKREAPRRVALPLLSALGLQPATIVEVAAFARTATSDCSLNDVALVVGTDEATYTAGQVAALFQLSGVCFALVRFWTVESIGAKNFWVSCNTGTENLQLVKLNLVLSPVVWVQSSQGVARTVIPPECRGLTPVDS